MPSQTTLLALLDERIAAIKDGGLLTPEIERVHAGVHAGWHDVTTALNLVWPVYLEAAAIVGAREVS